MLCNKCGNNVPNGMKTCTICGNRLSAPPKDPKFNAYLEKVSAKYFAQEYIKIGSFDVTDLKEAPGGVDSMPDNSDFLGGTAITEFMPKNQNLFSFITYVENITPEIYKEYYDACMNHIKKKIKTGSCYFVMAGKNISNEVYEYKKVKPNMFNIIKGLPVIIDLRNNKVSYSFSKISVGTAFYDSFVEYLESKFIVNFDDIKVE